MEDTSPPHFECGICQETCGSKWNLQVHIGGHIKKRKQDRGCSAFYLGSNSFKQLPDQTGLTCKTPQLITDDVSFISSNLSSIAWMNSKKKKLTYLGLRQELCTTESITLASPSQYNKLFHGFGTICTFTDKEIVSLLPTKMVVVLNKMILKNLKNSSENLKDIKICGKTVYCLTSKGRIFNLSESEQSKAVIELPGTVFSFDCGEEHCIAATKEKEVFSWGSSLKGQLGRGTLKEEPSPTRIAALGGLNIIQVVCGKWHNVALTSEGDLYVWGWNKYGQLGLPCPDFENLESIETGTTVLAEPTLLDFQIGVRKIACGSTHTVVIADDLTVWGCGFAKFGQLGNQDKEKIDKLVPLKLQFPGKVIDIQASNWSTIFMVETTT